LAASGAVIDGYGIGLAAGAAGAAGAAAGGVVVCAAAVPAKARPSDAAPAQQISFRFLIDYPLIDAGRLNTPA
jgi:hypothetical protein